MVEAALAGVPIVASNAGIAGDILKNNEHASVCTVNDVSCFVSSIEKIFADKNVAVSFTTKAKEAILNNTISTKEEYLSRYAEMWKACLTRG